MKIAFDLRRIGNPGIGRYMKCLVEAVLQEHLDNEYVLLLPPDKCSLAIPDFCKLSCVIPRARYYSIHEQIELPRILREHRVDLLHSPHFLLPLALPCPAVVTIHDVIYLACREDLPSPLGRLYYSAMMRASSKCAKTIVTDSVFSKNEIVRYLHVRQQKLQVIYPAVDSSFQPVQDDYRLQQVLSKHGIDGDYIFYTGIYKPRKNHAGLLKSFQHLLSAGAKAKLVISGPVGAGEHALQRLAAELEISSHVIFTGFVNDAELCALYSAARVYACPSTYEGFGFTVLEAMACNVPVVCSNSASLPEVAGDAALYADARNPEKFAYALHRALVDENLRRQLISRGFRNLQRFSWKNAAAACLSAYEEVAGQSLYEPAAA
ncbi:MAG TPA: glycosyltransferase family 1 protein [Terriglobales bacterium]|nr:glycosyltransferase family 1 protein [Terriglobales bacterium]